MESLLCQPTALILMNEMTVFSHRASVSLNATSVSIYFYRTANELFIAGLGLFCGFC